jgi:hypothetical protein
MKQVFITADGLEFSSILIVPNILMSSKRLKAGTVFRGLYESQYFLIEPTTVFDLASKSYFVFFKPVT